MWIAPPGRRSPSTSAGGEASIAVASATGTGVLVTNDPSAVRNGTTVPVAQIEADLPGVLDRLAAEMDVLGP